MRTRPTAAVFRSRDDGWAVASVNEDKLIDRDALCRMANRLAASSANVHAVLVARGAKLVFSDTSRVPTRSTAAGWKRHRTIDTLHNIKSATKSVASLALGIAIDRGLIQRRQPIFSFFLTVWICVPRRGPPPAGTRSP
jgi:CubicO group peptidase (beta-lactamase class C family)